MAESESSDDLLQESVPAADAPAITSLLSFQIGIVVIATLYLAREVLVPITAAILLSFVLAHSSIYSEGGDWDEYLLY
ncbi:MULTISPECIES: hypothetical protein [Bradyrhizobium]|uniref:hypothetical protein n=1 Tax=Bradyrhizobium TaxID=374 RepID=UPI00195B35C0|nr:hypothetical protein [Bradyrhizobium canariense]MBM7483878.1 hypothetical protein [Bradyrhizobium canariense]UFW74912.1 hypothetical protein BcanWU425_14590 [Bradyrhizobium canariense]